MPNHVHLTAVPASEDGLRRAIGEAQRRYTRRVNAREGWRGPLWQGRFTPSPMDEPCLLTAARYIEQSPVRAGPAARPSEDPWSSAKARGAGRDDSLGRAAPLLKLAGTREDFLSLETRTSSS